MKKPKQQKLELNKVTLRNLDEPSLNSVAGGLDNGNAIIRPLHTQTCCRTSCF